MKFVWLLCWLGARIALAQETSHWMVTETGLIQPRDDSPFVMTRPFDLLSFLNQDTRWENIFNIYHDLIRRQKIIFNLWLKLVIDANFDQHIAENHDCLKVGGSIESLDWYKSFIDDGSLNSIPEKEFALQRSEYGETEVPDCKKISSLTFSMFAFEHLESMRNRENLNATPEMVLPEMIYPIMTVDQFGHWLSNVLRKNTSSWLHYNLAAMYWRIKGNMPKALECSRRAVHYAPRHHKNIALLCLGSILHRSRHTEDAVVVLTAAVDHDPSSPVSHFALGGALAVTGDFNDSLKHLDFNMTKHSQFDEATRYKHGVLCHLDMFNRMQTAKSTLKELIEALEKYNDIEKQWLRFQTAFLKTMKHEEEYDYKNYERNCIKMGEITGLKMKTIKSFLDRAAVIQYILTSPTYNEDWEKLKGVSALDTALALHRMVTHLGRHTNMSLMKFLPKDDSWNQTEILKEIGPVPSFPDMFPDLKRHKPRIKTEFNIENNIIKQRLSDARTGSIETETSKPHTGKLLYPSNLKVNRNKETFDTDADWPSGRFCMENQFPDNIEAVYPVFLPFENKGIKLEYLLTEKIGVPVSVEHELPWHPPVCPTDKDLTLHTHRKGIKIQLVADDVGKEFLQQQLFKYLSGSHSDILKNMQEAEIGQRIQTAINKKLAAKWVLFTIASLYWRVRGNLPSALNCLLTASRTADGRYRDVVLASLASVFLEMGLLDECSKHAEEAYKISPYEPATNFILAQLSMIQKSPKAHIFHMKQSVRVEASFMGGLVRRLLNGWACVFKQVNKIKDFEMDDKELCAEVQPGVSMVCDSDGSNCRVTNQLCSSAQTREISQVVRMLELKDDTFRSRSIPEINSTIFNKFVEDTPADRTDKAAHLRHLDKMIKMIDGMVQLCATHGCRQVAPLEVDITDEEECSFQHLQLDYWLHVMSFRQEVDTKLPADIIATKSSTESVPECRAPAGWADDFFLERMMSIDTDGWEPLLRLMHQFAEMFSFYDYTELGAKIARYIEMKPKSWGGLVIAGWWCGASGRGGCASRCLAAAHALAPARYQAYALRPLTALLYMQSKQIDAHNMAYLSFYGMPKSKVDAFLLAVSHAYKSDYEQAVWLYRYALTFDDQFLPAKACLHISMCIMLVGEKKQLKTPA